METKLHSNSINEFIHVLIVVLFIITFVAQGTAVPTGSMEPTILVGDRLILDKFTLRANTINFLEKIRLGRPIRRGDVIVFRPVLHPEGEYLVKRVIGMPGETLEIRNKQVYINGQILNEPYVSYEDPMTYGDLQLAPSDLYQRDNYGPIKIPAKSFFAMGDNRDKSLDSRYWGFVPQDYVLGRPLFVFWSYEDEPYRQRSFVDTMIQYGRRVVHFLSKTRWRRTGTIIR